MCVRFVTLVLMSWANIYCCCTAPSADLRAQSDQPKRACCADKPSPVQVPQHRMPDGRKCDQCPYLAIRQTTLLDDAHVPIPPLDLFVWDAPVESDALALAVPTTPIDRWTEPIPISVTLLDLNTSLVR